MQPMLLMAASSLFASIVSLISSYLTHSNAYFHWTQVLFANGAVGCIICGLIWLLFLRKCGGRHFGNPENFKWLCIRAVFGLIENASAFLAMRYLDLADANVIMFTNPMMTGVLAWLIFGQKWKWYDYFLTCCCLAGVVLVARPAFAFPAPVGAGSGQPEWERTLGILAALSFSLSLAGANLVIHEKIREEHTNTITAYMFQGIVLLVWPSFFWVPPSGFLDPILTQDETFPTLLLLGIGAVFTLFQFSRSYAFQTATDASVVNALYLEIVFAFVWQSTLLKQPVQWTSAAGAGLIVASSFVAGAAKAREEAQADEDDYPMDKDALLSGE